MKTFLIFLLGALAGAIGIVALIRVMPDAAPTLIAAAPSNVVAPCLAPPRTGEVAMPAQAIPPTIASLPAVQANPIALPIAGIGPAQLKDTFDEARGSERHHEALDISAPKGTPVHAAVDGKVAKLFDSKPGGLTVYQFDGAEKFVYYYAHLERYAPGVKEGDFIKQGELVGYVGSTGNADPATPHLHFAIFELDDDKQWWKGRPINPFPMLGGVAQAKVADVAAPKK